MILLTFFWIVIILPTYYKHRLQSFRSPWKHVKKFERRRLHYSLVKHCLCHSGQRPCHLNGSFFSSPCCIKHRRWSRRNAKARARHKWRRTSTSDSILFTNTLIDNNVSHPRLFQDFYGATLKYISVMALNIF